MPIRPNALGMLLATGILLTSLGCGKPRIDTSSDEKMKTSMESVRSSLPKDKRDDFDEAIQVLAFNSFDLSDLFAAGTTPGLMDAKVKSLLGGKTGDEIIREAEAVEQQREVKEREQAVQEIQELGEKRAAAERDKAQLSRFQVLRSRFLREPQALMEQVIIELTVRNGTSQAISRAHFVGTLASPGRTVPWVKDSFNYEISGGLEPNEEASWRLAPNLFSDWGQAKPPADAIFTVDVVRLDGADGKELFSSLRFTDLDAARLEELTKKFGVKPVGQPKITDAVE